MSNSCEDCGSEEKMGSQKISVSDHINGFQYTADKSDNFVIDMDSFSHPTNKDNTANSRITLQRSHSRKGSQRVVDKKIGSIATSNDRDNGVATSSPRGPSTPEKSSMVAVGTMDNCSSPQVHHQITINTCNISTPTESRGISRRNSFRRSPWLLDPKRVLFLFATLSSMGTILLIYFTLSIGKHNANEDGPDW
ncbi:uncharacterized protein LOC126727191 [Quercus robur]|uniref:uncharacterized protein LOC126727191 n=1 Tax=Quercus robur TaxID=38942 RepID=UPI002162E0F2|nr:uncharacterized protein LOC126727191 [Quercus robur]XP_050288698.1 uncharacterized protein LOC126727191 [Quercus robur]